MMMMMMPEHCQRLSSTLCYFMSTWHAWINIIANPFIGEYLTINAFDFSKDRVLIDFSNVALVAGNIGACGNIRIHTLFDFATKPLLIGKINLQTIKNSGFGIYANIKIWLRNISNS